MIFYICLAVFFILSILFCYKGYKFIHVFNIAAISIPSFFVLTIFTENILISALVTLGIAVVAFLLRRILMIIVFFLFGCGIGFGVSTLLSSLFGIEGTLFILMTIGLVIACGVVAVLLRNIAVILMTATTGASGMSGSIFTVIVYSKIMAILDSINLDALLEAGDIEGLTTALTEGLSAQMESLMVGFMVAAGTYVLFTISGIIVQAVSYSRNKE